MESLSLDDMDPHAALALLDWQVELGVVEAIGDVPIDRYDLPEPVAKSASQPASNQAPAVPKAAADDPVAEAEAAAKRASTLPELAAAMEAYDHCTLKRGARSFVFGAGQPGAQVMIIGDAPDRDEDRVGQPFVGRAGQLLDKMTMAIGLDRNVDGALYLTNVLPWRPSQNRNPDAKEFAMMLPFLRRHIALVDPKVVILMGSGPCTALLGRGAISRLRGSWADVPGKPAMPIFHPTYLMQRPAAKRDAWADLLAVQAKLRSQ